MRPFGVVKLEVLLQSFVQLNAVTDTGAALKEKLDVMLAREQRTDLAQACFDFLPARARLDLAGWPETDIFSHE